jgi:serine/threonine-protein kinase RsbW
MSLWWCLQLRREVASVPLARRLLCDAMETAGVDREVSYDMALALSEACANAVEHGTGERSDAYRVTAYLDGDLCSIEVADAGPGFCGKGMTRPSMRAPDAESGRGLFIIESLADRVRVQNRPGRGGAVVTFDKTLKWQDARREGDGSLLKAG